MTVESLSPFKDDDTVKDIVTKLEAGGYPKAAKLIKTSLKGTAEKGTTWGDSKFPVSIVSNAVKLEIEDKKQ
jgi:hypothetical protein